MMRWGFPPPPNFGTAPVTNVLPKSISPDLAHRGFLFRILRLVFFNLSLAPGAGSSPAAHQWAGQRISCI
jgi:hypothetical protein